MNKEDIPSNICVAACNGNIEMLKLLLNVITNIHAQDDYAIHEAICNGNLEIVKLLLRAITDAHAQDDYAIQVALKIAIKKGYTEIINLLNKKIKGEKK